MLLPLSDLPGARSTGFSFAGFRLEADGALFRGETPLHLPPKELAALRLLLAHAGQIVTPVQLNQALWPDVHVSADSVPKCLSSLRARLQPEDCIQTVYKRGYRLNAEVSPLGVAPADALPRLAIPPFATEFGVPEHLGPAIAEETIARLSNAPHPLISVLARDSVFTLARRGLTALEIGLTLHADLVLTGTLRTLPSQFRLRAEMIRVADGAQIWVEDLLMPHSLIAGLEADLVNRLVFRIDHQGLTISAAATAPANLGGPFHREAYELFLRGRHEWQTLERHRMQDGLQNLLRATELDPSLIAARVDLAHLCVTQGLYGFMSPAVAADIIRQTADPATPPKGLRFQIGDSRSPAMGPGRRATDSKSSAASIGRRATESKSTAARVGRRAADSKSPATGLGRRVEDSNPSAAGFGRRAADSRSPATGLRRRGEEDESIPTLSHQPEAILPALGWINFHFDRDLPAAIRAFSLSAHLPYDPWTTRARVIFALSRHRFAEAVALLRAGMRLDPFSPWLHARLAWAHHLAGNSAESLEYIQTSVAQFPEQEGACIYGAISLAFNGDTGRAVQLAQDISQRLPYFDLATVAHAYTLACAGRPAEARAILERLQWLSRERFVLKSFNPAVYVALGDLDAALSELRAAAADRCPWFFQMLADPRLKPLHGRSGFHELQAILTGMEAAAAASPNPEF